MTTRRQFIITSMSSAVMLAAARPTFAQAALVEESDPTATALGYKHDASTVDAAKYPTFKAGNLCSNCQLYQGKDGDESGPCMAMGGKLVNANGWCTAWAAKA
jgi:hypothetical protein